MCLRAAEDLQEETAEEASKYGKLKKLSPQSRKSSRDCAHATRRFTDACCSVVSVMVRTHMPGVLQDVILVSSLT